MVGVSKERLRINNRILVTLALIFCLFANLTTVDSRQSTRKSQQVDQGRDFYKILEIKKNASDKEVKKAYKKLSIQWHPDKNPDDATAKDKFTEIAFAYEVLSEPERRRKYDRMGEYGMLEAEQRENQPSHGFFGRQQQEQLGPSITLKIRATLNELYTGKDFEMTYNRKIICPHCRGSGADDPDDLEVCPHCQGQGHTIKSQQIAPGFVQQFQETCRNCGGEGTRRKSTCHVCHSNMLVDSIDTLYVFVEKGTKDNHVIEFQDAADEFKNVRSGNVIVKVEEIPHKTFMRKGNDLRLKVTINLKEALLGFVKEIQHLDGHEVELDRFGKVTKPGFIQRISGEGMPFSDYSQTYGDLVVEYVVDFPKTLTDQQKVLFKGFFAL